MFLKIILLALLHLGISSSMSTIQGWPHVPVDYSLVHTSLLLCHNELNVPGKLSVSTHFHHLVPCIKHKWIQCLDARFILSNLKKRNQTALSPCFLGLFINAPDVDGKFNIKSHKKYQIQLIFNHFKLKRSYTGCVSHSVEVGLEMYL